MRKFRLLVLLLCAALLSGSSVFAQLIISWNPGTLSGTFGPSPWTPASIDPAVTSPTLGLVRGSSLLTSGSPAGGCYGSSGGWSSGGGEANSFYFSVSASCHEMSLSSLAGSTRRSSSGPGGCNVYYSINGGPYIFINTWTTASTSGTVGTPGSSVLTGITDLQNIPAGTDVRFKITPNGTTGNWYFTNTSLALNGTVNPVVAPTLVTSPLPSTIVAGTGTTFSVSGVSGAASYQWQRNTSGLSGGTWVNITSATLDPTGTYSGFTTTSTATSNTLTLSSVPASWDGYAYRCVVTNCAGTVTSSPALLNVSSGTCSGAPASGTAIAATPFFCGSGSTTLSLSGGTAGGGISYQWSSSSTNTPPGTDIPGATNASYTTGTLTDTMYYWCTTTCATSSISVISAVGAVNIEALPTVTATGGAFCSGTSGLTITATGASTYGWSPATGLSGVTGSSVVASPSVNTTYTVTGTSASGCSSTATALVTYNITPTALTISPATSSVCAGTAPLRLIANGGSVGPTTVNSGSITIPATIGALGTITHGQIMAGVPAGAVITGAEVNLVSFGSQYQDDYVVNISAPNGNTLNLINQRGSHTATVTTLFSNTRVSSLGATSLATGSGTFTGLWTADAVVGVGAPAYLSNTASWSTLFSIPNGTWTLSIFNNTTFSNIVVPTAQWSLTLYYTYKAPVVWSPIADLYTDAGAISAYVGAAADTVYYDPASATTTTISGVASNNGCSVSAATTITVNASPAALTGTLSVCEGATTTLSSTSTGGTWTVSNANATVSSAGVVTGVSAGTVNITYTLAGGCFAIATVTVNTTPASIVLAPTVCEGTTTLATNATPGGAWSNSTANTYVDPAGIVSGIGGGLSVISYTLPSGCFAIDTIEVLGAPTPILGTRIVCEGATTALSVFTSGGTWSTTSSNFTVDISTGVVTGISAGVDFITYTRPTTCFIVREVTVLATPAAIAGPSSVCEGSIINLSSATTGGNWTSSSSRASVGLTTGVVNGVLSGTATITYTATNSCFVTHPVTVNQSPTAIAGPSGVCVGSTVNLTNAITPGIWTISGSNATIVAATGAVTGVTTGTAGVTYTLANGCARTAFMSVFPLPSAITGAASLCLGNTTPVSSTPAGGTWSASNANVSFAGSNITALAIGTSTITYTLPTGCIATRVVTVNSVPAPISGAPTVCRYSSISLTSITAGGTWSSSNPVVANVNSFTGDVVGLNVGTATISYSLGSVCFVTHVVSVNSIPPANVLTSGGRVCEGQTLTVSNSMTGGIWTVNDPIQGSVDAGGVVTGLNAGSVIVSYVLPTGCAATSTVFIDPTPDTIIGVSSLCTDRTTVLYSITTGGVWVSSNTTVANVGIADGITRGLSAGTATITYVLPTGCLTTKQLTINPSPVAIVGDSTLCLGAIDLLVDTSAGGVWSSSAPGIAAIDTIGGISALAVGTATISYILPTGCYAGMGVTVNALPNVYNVGGGGSYCTGGAGMPITLSGSELGVRYSLIATSLPTIMQLGTGLGITYSGVTAAGIYSIEARDTTTGCVSSMTGTATITPLIIEVPAVSIDATPSDPICSGTIVTYSAMGSGTGTSPVYNWRVNGVPVSVGASYTYAPVNGDVLTVRLNSSAVCRIIDSAIDTRVLTVIPTVIPGIYSTVGPNDTVCSGNSVLHASTYINGGTTPSVYWLVNGAYADSGSTMMRTPANGDDVTAVLVSSAQCRTTDTVYSAPINITVLPTLTPIVNITAMPGTSVITGQTVTFTAAAVNAGSTPLYQWKYNGTPIAGATNATFTTSTLHNMSTVSCAVTSRGECGGVTTEGAVVMTVTDFVGVAEVASSSDVQLFPNPNTGSFTVSVADASSKAITVMDVAGRVVNEVAIVAGSEDVQVTMPSSAAAGVYLVQIIGSNGVQTMKFTLIK